ncbi:hypothetical protein [Psychromonas sp. MME2]|uniref:hypothetical protein n=1 Tax=unclassified Psychromonas TaxID=2614957 RepID=UPI00339C24BD
MLNEQFTPFVISPFQEGPQECYLLENGNESFKAIVTDKIHFKCDTPCLGLIDYEVLDHKVLITEVHLIATNVDKIKLLSWLQSIELNLVGYLVILISLITKVNDNELRASVLEVIFHEELHPRNIIEENAEKIKNLYPPLIVAGQKVFSKYQSSPCSQIVRDKFLVRCLLSLLIKNELIANSSKYLPVKILINEKLASLQI